MNTARKPGSLHRLALGVVLVAAAAAPLGAVATPAEAATTAHGCTVRPLKPTPAGTTAGGVALVDYEVVFACAAGRTIEVQQTLMEDDAPPDPDDFVGTQVSTRSFASTTVAHRVVNRTVPNTENGNEELYQKTRFRVSVGGGPLSPWTNFESGPTLSIAG